MRGVAAFQLGAFGIPGHQLSRRKIARCSAATNVEQLPLELIPQSGGLPAHWGRPGVYGVYDRSGSLQYVASVKNISEAIDAHRVVLRDSERVHAVRMIAVEESEMKSVPLDELAENWVVAHCSVTEPPVGNTDSSPEWRQVPRVGAENPNLYFSTGGFINAETEIMRILRMNKIVLFMKGTYDKPMCGFSQLALRSLNETAGKNNFKVVDCLDAHKNPGLRDAIKTFSKWPTIPQLYINGDFVGGSDIVDNLAQSGELKQMVDESLAAPVYLGN